MGQLIGIGYRKCRVFLKSVSEKVDLISDLTKILHN